MCMPEKLKDNYAVLPGLDGGLRDTIMGRIIRGRGS